MLLSMSLLALLCLFVIDKLDAADDDVVAVVDNDDALYLFC